MKRRSFVKASFMAGSLAGLVPAAAMAENMHNGKKAKQEFYELRTYILKDRAQQKLVEDYLQNAAIPALNRFGSNNIGVFTELKPEDQTKIYVVIPFTSVEYFISIHYKLANDAAYQQAATAYLGVPATEPAYNRMESSLLQAFAGMPKLVAPEKKPRLFELRRYESASETAAKKKIDMFNTAGELAIFKKAGLRPVFFGETLIGGLQPNLTYMLTYDDMAEHDKNWKAFGTDPEWKKLSSTPEFTDARLVSKITAIFLVPTDYSQI